MQIYVIYDFNYGIVCILIMSDTTVCLFGLRVCSVIEVGSPELAKKTIEVMHRADIRGRQIIVREARNEFMLS